MKITHDWDQVKNVKHLIKMKGHKFDAAKIYFQKPGVCTTQRATGDGGKLTELHSHLERLFADVLMYVRLLVKVGHSVFRKSEREHKAVMYVILHPYQCECGCERQPPIHSAQHSSTTVFASEPPICKRFHFVKKYI